MADEEELVEVGYGDDAEIVWTGGLTWLNDIDEILAGYESVEMDIAEDKLTRKACPASLNKPRGLKTIRQAFPCPLRHCHKLP